MTDLQAGTVPITLHLILYQVTETTTAIPTVMIHTTDRATKETTIETEDTNITQDMTKETRITKTSKIIIKIGTGSTTEDDQININTTGTSQKVQIIFEYTDQNLLEMMQMVKSFINFMKANPATRDQFKSNKLAVCKEYNNEVNESRNSFKQFRSGTTAHQ